MTSKQKIFALAATVLSALFFSAGARAEITVNDAWVRATVEHQPATGAFMLISASQDSALVRAASPVAAHVEIHEMRMENEIMKMRQIDRLALPAGQTVELKPGGYHIMLLDLHQQMQEGGHVPLSLTFENSNGEHETVEISAPVRALAGGAHTGHGQQHAKH